MNMNKKKVIIFTFMSMMAFAMKAENTDISGMENVIYIEPCTAEAGSEYVMSVKMKNSSVAESFGFDLVLTDGITDSVDEYGDPIAELSTERTNDKITDHFDAAFKLDGTLNIQAYSSKGRTISGNEGEVCLITINIAAGMTPGIYPLLIKNIAISDDNSVTYTEDLVETSIEIISGGDGRTVLDETSTTVPVPATNVDVRVKRTINANQWSTIVLPFAMTEEQVKEAFGDGVQLADFTGYEVTETGDAITGITVNFVPVTAIQANRPYIIWVGTAVTEFTVDGVTVDPVEKPQINYGTNKKPKSFVGTYVADFDFYDAAKNIPLFLSANKFYYATEDTKHMKAFRAYFDFDDVLTDVEEAANVKMFVNTDDATGIHSLNADLNPNETIYNLAGQRVGKNYKGIVIENGKKIMK